MPFGDWADDYYDNIYCPAIESAGLTPKRADDIYRPGTIINDIWSLTKNAKVILADLSEKNPNVLYELGLAHAIAKPVILMTESMDFVPFDLRALRVIVYDKNAPNWGDLVKESIQKAIKEVLSSPKEAILPTFLKVSETFAPPVTRTEKKLLEMRQELELLKNEISSGRQVIEGERRIVRERFGPMEARKMMAYYSRKKVPKKQIVEKLVELGAPRRWAVRSVYKKPSR